MLRRIQLDRQTTPPTTLLPFLLQEMLDRTQEKKRYNPLPQMQVRIPRKSRGSQAQLRPGGGVGRNAKRFRRHARRERPQGG